MERLGIQVGINLTACEPIAQIPGDAPVRPIVRGIRITFDGVVKSDNIGAIAADPATKPLWKRFQVATQLREKSQQVPIRLVHSLTAITGIGVHSGHAR